MICSIVIASCWTPDSPPLKMACLLWLIQLYSTRKTTLSSRFSDIWAPPLLWSSNTLSQERISDSFCSHSGFPLSFLPHWVLSLICVFVFSSFFDLSSVLFPPLTKSFVPTSLAPQQERCCHREKSGVTVALLKLHTAYSTRALLSSERKI